MSKRNKLITLIVSLVLLVCMTITSVVFLVVEDKNVADDRAPAITAEETGAKSADISLKGGVLYLTAGAKYTMTGGSITANQNVYGGAVYVSSGATFTMTGGTISNCTARYGGAIYVEEGGTCEITGGSIIECSGEYGYAIFVETGATLRIDEDNTTIEDNYYQEYSVRINIYEDGAQVSSYVDSDFIFDVSTANANGLSYENCAGYFLDEDLTEPLCEGVDITEIINDSGASTFKTATQSTAKSINVYTKQVSDDEVLEKFTFTAVDSTTCSVAAKSASISGEVVIPAMHDGLFVTQTMAGTASSSTQTGFDNCNSITNVIIPTHLKKINDYSFEGCSSLTKLNIPIGLEYVGSYSYSGCVNLTNVTWGKGIKTLGTNVFNGCSNLVKIDISDYQAYCNMEVVADGGVYSGAENMGLYLDGSVITDVYFPDEITTLNAVFSGYGKLLSITIPSSVSVISDDALYDCNNLVGVKVTSGVVSIGKNAFAYCDNLTYVYINSSVSTISSSGYEDSPFYNSSNMLGIYCDFTEKQSGWGDYFNYKDGSEQIPVYYNVDSTNEIYEFSGPWIYSITEEETTFIAGSAYATIISYLGSETSVVVPQSFTNLSTEYIVKALGASAFSNNKIMETITIHSDITKIGTLAFYNCSALTNLYIENLESWCEIDFESSISNPMREDVYINNVLTTEITIPEAVSVIKNCTFANWSSLAKVNNISSVASIGDYAFYNCSTLGNLEVSNSTTLGAYTFAGCESFTEINIPSSLTELKDGVYRGCTGITSVQIPNSITQIGQYAFYETGLKAINIPNTVTTIGAYAFKYCSDANTLTIGEGVSSIGQEAFAYCESLATLNYNAVFINALYNVFLQSYSNSYRAQLTLNIGEKVTKIPDGMFAELTYSGVYHHVSSSDVLLVAINIAESSVCKTFGDYAFYYCTALVNVDLPQGLERIGDHTFENCYKMQEFELPSTLNYIGEVAFYSCDELQHLTIPDSITAIYAETFRDCRGLESIELPSNLTSIGNYAFAECMAITSITIPESVTSIGSHAFWACGVLTSINIPSGVTEISDYMLAFCYNLKEINLHDKITSIGSKAFYSCSSLTSITIPESVELIGSEAFGACDYLKTINFNAIDIKSSNYRWNYFIASGHHSTGITLTIGAKVKKIPVGLFGYYDSSASIDVSNIPYITEIVFAEGSVCTEIGERAFNELQYLKNITIPESVKIIGNSAFYNCLAVTEFNYHANISEDYDEDSFRFYKLGNDGAGVALNIGANVTRIPAYLFSPASGSFSYANIKTVTFENGSVCTSIGAYAFYSCRNMISINIPFSVTNIGDYAFASCSNLTINFERSESSVSENVTLGTNWYTNVEAINYGVSSSFIPPMASSINVANYVNWEILISDDKKYVLN